MLESTPWSQVESQVEKGTSGSCSALDCPLETVIQLQPLFEAQFRGGGI